MIEEVKDQYMVQSMGSQPPQNRTFRVSARLIPERSMKSTTMTKTLKEEGLYNYHEKDSTQLSQRNERSVSKMTFNQLLRKSATRNRNENTRTPVSHLKIKVNGVSKFNEPTSAKDNLSISSNSTGVIKRVSYRALVNISGDQSNKLTSKDQKEDTNLQLENCMKNEQIAEDKKIEGNVIDTSQTASYGQIIFQANGDKTNTSQVNSYDQKIGSNHSNQEKKIYFATNAHDQTSLDQIVSKEIDKQINNDLLQDTTQESNQTQKVKTNEHLRQKKSFDLQIVDFQILPEKKQVKTPTNLSPHQTQSNRSTNSRSLFSNVKTENNLKNKSIQKKGQAGQNHFISTKIIIQPSNASSFNKTPSNSNEKVSQMQTKKLQNPSTPIGVYQKNSKFKNDFPLENYDRRGYLNLKKSMAKTPRQSKQQEGKKNQNNEISVQNQHFASIQPTTFWRKQQQTENKGANGKKSIRLQGLNVAQRSNNQINQTGQSPIVSNSNQNSARTNKSIPLSVKSKYPNNNRIPSIQPRRQVDFNSRGQSDRLNIGSKTNSTPERGSKTRSGFSASADQKISKSKESTPEKIQVNKMTIVENELPVKVTQIENQIKYEPTGENEFAQNKFELDNKESKEDKEAKNNLNTSQIKLDPQDPALKEDVKVDLKSQSVDTKNEVKEDEEVAIDSKLINKKTSNQGEDELMFDLIEKVQIGDDKIVQKMIHYQSQDLLKDDSNMILDAKETNSELIKDQQHNSMMVELNQPDDENCLKQSEPLQDAQISMPGQDMMSWRSPHMQSLNILQKDGESMKDTVKTPHLANFGMNSPRTGTSFKKGDINGSIESHQNLMLIGKKQSLNTINCNDSGMNIQENPYSGQSSIMQSFQKDIVQSSDQDQKRLDETLRDEESIINKIQPQLLKQDDPKNCFFEPISPNKLSIVPEQQPLKGFDSFNQPDLNSTNSLSNPQSYIEQQQVSPLIISNFDDNQHHFTPIQTQNNIQSLPIHQPQNEVKPIEQISNSENNDGQKVQKDEQDHQQVQMIKKCENKDNSESEEENSQNLMAEMNASFSSKLFKQNFNVQQQLKQRSHSPTRAYINQYSKQGNKQTNEAISPKMESNCNKVKQFDEVCQSNQNLEIKEQLISKDTNLNEQQRLNGNEIVIEIVKPDMKNNMIIIKEPFQNQYDIKLNTRYQVKDESPQLKDNLQQIYEPVEDKQANLELYSKAEMPIDDMPLEQPNCIQYNDQLSDTQQQPEIEEEKPKMKILNLKDQMCPQTYNVCFSIRYKVNYGEQIAIVGNIKQLGNWTNTSKAMLQWTEGDVWVLKNLQIHVDNPLTNDSNTIQKKGGGTFNFFDSQPQNQKKIKHFFQYKYVVIESHSKQIVRIEKGPNRLADLNLKYFEAFDRQIFINDEEKNDYVDKILQSEPQNLVYKDDWETISVNFSMYYPLNEGEILRIFGDTLQLGNWSCKIAGYQDKPGELEAKLMAPMSKQIPWLTGELVTPFEYSVTFNLQNMPHRLKYKYSVQNNIVKRTVWEREPTREIQLQDPNKYEGELGNERSNLWRNVFPVFIVNGHIEKADANFVGDMRFDQIGCTNISLGQYPQTEDDIDLLKQAGLTGVFNVQTEGDLSFRGVNQKLMMKYYQQVGINACHFPIQDFNEHELTSKLFEAAKILNDMINNKGLNVYVHCTAGMGRAPASVVCYLCLFKKVKGWQDPYYVDKLVKKYRKVSVPNMNAVCNVINANRNFQNQQHENTVE